MNFLANPIQGKFLSPESLGQRIKTLARLINSPGDPQSSSDVRTSSQQYINPKHIEKSRVGLGSESDLSQKSPKVKFTRQESSFFP